MNKPKSYPESLWLAVMANAPSFIRQTGEQATRVDMADHSWLIITLPSELKVLAMSRPDRKAEIEKLLLSETNRKIQVSFKFRTQRGKHDCRVVP
jgi:hypothetical protein